MSKFLERRPKGYNVKVWQVMYENAINDKKWAFETVRNAEWTSRASTTSLQTLGKYLYESEFEMAKDAYEYFAIRAHGTTCIGLLDLAAHKRWVEITGRAIPKSKLWKYDHTINKTSAKLINGKFI